MKKSLLVLASSCVLTQFAASQTAVLFTGRFPFVNFDAALNAGSIPQMS